MALALLSRRPADSTDNFYTSGTADQARKTAFEVKKLGSDVKKDFDDTISRGKEEAASILTDEAKAVLASA